VEIQYGVKFDKYKERILSWDERSIYLWSSETGNLIADIMEHIEPIGGVKFDKHEERILSWDKKFIYLWSAKTGKLIADTMKLPSFEPEKVERISHAGKVKLITDTIYNNAVIHNPKFHNNEEQILGWKGNTINSWHTETGKLIGPSMNHIGYIYGVRFDQNEKRLLSWSSDGEIILWDISTCERIAKIMKHENCVLGAIFDKNEERILSWSDDGIIKLWDAKTGEQIGKTMQHEEKVDRAMFNSNEQCILSWSDNGTIKLRDIPGDLDLPKNDFLLQTQVTTGTIYNENTDALEVIPPAEWQEKKKACYKKRLC